MNNEQPKAMIVADALTCEASFDIHHLAIKAMKEGASLLRTQHAAIERKDALLRQCLKHVASNISMTSDGTEAEELYDLITKELSQ